MLRSIALVAVAICACGAAQDARETFQEIYARLDAAIAAKDQPGIDRLIATGAEVPVGPNKWPLRGWIGIQSSVEGISRHSEVKSATIQGDRAVVVAEILLVDSNSGSSNRMTDHDTWERSGDTWVCISSERTEGESSVRPTSADEAKPVVAELQKRAVQLDTIMAGSGFEDLEAFGQAIGNARIVALGEAAHGTQEFSILKRRLIEYLMEKKGFSVVAWELDWAEENATDRYVMGEDMPGTPAAQNHLAQYMRNQNRAGSHLSWTGFDMQSAGPAADQVLAYLRRVAPEAAKSAREAYTDARRIVDDHSILFPAGAREAAQRAEAVLAQFDAQRGPWIAQSSAGEWRDARHAAVAVRDAATMRVEGNGPRYRDRAMAQNVEWLANEKYPGQKIILSAHNGHLGSQGNQMGGWLRKSFGDSYYVVGTAFQRGEILAYGVDGKESKGIGAWPVAPAPEGTGSAILGAAGMPLFFLDVRSVPRDGALGGWLEIAHLFNFATALVTVGKENMISDVVRGLYDGLIFVEEVHAAH